MADYQNPVGDIIAGRQFLWIILTAKSLSKITAYARKTSKGGDTIVSSESGISFQFLAPNEIGENIGHSWETYDTISSRLAGKAADIKNLGAEGTAAKKGAEGAIKGAESGSTEQARGGLTAGAAGAAIAKSRVDTPLNYKDSTRREYNFTFQLLKMEKSDPLEIIRKLEELSCASYGKGPTGIEYPHIFRIETNPPGLINVKNAALTAVQPTFKGPYVDGRPIAADVQLTFKELDPLYSHVITNTTPITVTIKSEKTDKDVDKTETSLQPATQKTRQIAPGNSLGGYTGAAKDAARKAQSSVNRTKAKVTKSKPKRSRASRNRDYMGFEDDD